jgi:hypothetical protein
MDAQELRNLQEAYLEVVMNEGKVNIDDKLSSGKTPRQKMKTKASNLDMDANIAGGVASSPSWRTSRAIRLGAKEQEGSLKKRAKKIREVERTQREQVDIYDIILSHLLDEGYAETPEAAEAIMVNMSEEWREDICEGYKKFPYKKVEDKIHEKEADSPTGRGTPQSVKMDKVFRHFKGEVRRTERREHSPKISKAKEAENRARGTQKG